MSELSVYNGRDNEIGLALSVDDVAIDHRDITRVVVLVDGSPIDSAVQPAWFTLGLQDRIALRLGHAGLAAGRRVGRLVTYDIAHPNGQEWPPELILRVRD